MKKLRVLIVDDDLSIAELLGDLLTGMGHEICTIAVTEADAVEAATRYKPDLMIVDARLGSGSGVAAVEAILRAGPIAHVFISGDAGGVQALRPGAVVVQKPFLEAELVQAIAVALEAAAVG